MIMRRVFYILTIISLLVMSLPSPVQAVTTTLTVTGETSRTGLYVGGAGDFTNLQSNDGDLTYLQTFAGSGGMYTFTAMPPVSSINSVTIHYVIQGVAIRPEILISGTTYSDGIIYPSGYTDVYKTFTTNPATGLAWTAAAINAASFGFTQMVAGDDHTTYMYLVVDYDATAPNVSTSAATVGVTTATLNGAITSTNGADVQSEGFVWDTASHTPLASTNVTPGNGYASWWYQNGTYGVGTFSHALTGLTSGQTYYYRATANNTYGWNYGDEVTFSTIGVPSVSTSAATYISTTVAQLNASVTNSNSQACDVRFGYGTTSQLATLAGFNAYDTRTAWVNNTYNTGDLPYASLTGLIAGTVYYYNVQIENDAGIGYGIEGTFTTYTGLFPPTSFSVIPSSTSNTLTWSKDPSSPLTMVRFSTSTYPNTTADGTLLYLGNLSSFSHTGLTTGTNYYYSAWGGGGGLYSTDKATVLGTTTAGSAVIPLSVPTSATSAWVAMPSELGLVNVPFYPYVNWAFDAFSLPRATGWVIIYIFFCLLLGMVIYMKAPSNNLLLTGLGMGVFLSFGSAITPPLIPIWATFIYIIMFATIAWVANRL